MPITEQDIEKYGKIGNKIIEFLKNNNLHSIEQQIIIKNILDSFCVSTLENFVDFEKLKKEVDDLNDFRNNIMTFFKDTKNILDTGQKEFDKIDTDRILKGL